MRVKASEDTFCNGFALLLLAAKLLVIPLNGCKADFAPESAPINNVTPNINRITAMPFQNLAKPLAWAGRLSRAFRKTAVTINSVAHSAN